MVLAAVLGDDVDDAGGVEGQVLSPQDLGLGHNLQWRVEEGWCGGGGGVESMGMLLWWGRKGGREIEWCK